MAIELRDKVIVITGASSGIGAATALACAKAGMHVVIAARRREQLDGVREQVEALGRRALAVTCDVQSDQEVQQLFDRTLETFNQYDAVFANAGFGICASVVDTTDQQARDIFETNFWGTIRCINIAMPYLIQRGQGHMLICSSAASEFGLPMYGFYAATKAAQDSIAGAMRAETEDTGVYVSSVHPIGTHTGFFESVEKVSGLAPGDNGLNAPRIFMQSSEHVARRIVRCLRRPRPEVWPSVPARMGLALVTAFPGLGTFAARRIIRRRK